MLHRGTCAREQGGTRPLFSCCAAQRAHPQDLLANRSWKTWWKEEKAYLQSATMYQRLSESFFNLRWCTASRSCAVKRSRERDSSRSRPSLQCSRGGAVSVAAMQQGRCPAADSRMRRPRVGDASARFTQVLIVLQPRVQLKGQRIRKHQPVRPPFAHNCETCPAASAANPGSTPGPHPGPSTPHSRLWLCASWLHSMLMHHAHRRCWKGSRRQSCGRVVHAIPALPYLPPHLPAC